MQDVLDALLGTLDPPTNYGLTVSDVQSVADCYDWESRVAEANWARDTDYETLAEMVTAEPAEFLTDISRYYGDDYYLPENQGYSENQGYDDQGYDDSMDGDHESALESVYGPNE